MKNYDIIIDYFKNGKILQCQSIELSVKAKCGEDAVKRISDAMLIMGIDQFDYRIVQVTWKGRNNGNVNI